MKSVVLKGANSKGEVLKESISDLYRMYEETCADNGFEPSITILHFTSREKQTGNCYEMTIKRINNDSSIKELMQCQE